MSVTRLPEGGVYPTREHAAGLSLKNMGEREKGVREKTSEMLGQVFFAPILAKMRESPFKTEMTSGGRGGEAFGQMMDGLMVKKIVSPTGQLVNGFAGGMIRQAGRQDEAQRLLKLEGESHVNVTG